MDKRAEIREKALKDLQQSEVLMLRRPFRLRQRLSRPRVSQPAPAVPPSVDDLAVRAGPASTCCRASSCSRPKSSPGRSTGGALLAHTIAGLLDSRRSLTHPPCSFAPFNYDPAGGFALRAVLSRASSQANACCSPTTCGIPGETFAQCAALVQEAGGTLVATVEIYDRMRSDRSTLKVPNFALAEYRAPENYKAADCPLCKAGMPITRF